MKANVNNLTRERLTSHVKMDGNTSTMAAQPFFVIFWLVRVINFMRLYICLSLTGRTLTYDLNRLNEKYALYWWALLIAVDKDRVGQTLS